MGIGECEAESGADDQTNNNVRKLCHADTVARTADTDGPWLLLMPTRASSVWNRSQFRNYRRLKTDT